MITRLLIGAALSSLARLNSSPTASWEHALEQRWACVRFLSGVREEELL